ncbi:RNA recognition motif domain-containing protein [Thiohalomonas denitrificans]|uniref:RNA recognition motif domain-containing protein n=1 Tax=Thiohalomonas denitrificans TaxID=415747 RepID=UPI0026EAC98A|nr:RNA-binding protein [Thiohalomonas denitrificans]
MELFVGNLPPGIESAELRVAFRRSVFLPVWMIRSAKVVEFRDRHGSIGHYGRVTLASRAIGRYAVRLMAKRRLQGYRVRVREFHYRAAGNERRALNWRLRHWGGIERRRSERRAFSESALTGTPLRCADPYQELQMG